LSEYQYYDFKAIDRALTKSEMAELRSISTRAAITSTSFTNHYEWGDLKADPLKLLEKYFDAFVYVANWGARELYLRLPQELVDYKQLKARLPGKNAGIRNSGKFVIVAFQSEVEFDDWDDGTGWMGSLMSLRSDLLRGNYRCLYLGWLLSVQHGKFSGGTLEPPVPAGLGELSAPLESLIEFLGIDEDLIEVAAAVSAPLSAGPSRKELADWTRCLPEKDKDNLLIAAVSDSGERWKNGLLRSFQHRSARTPVHGAVQRRAVEELLTAARGISEERERLLQAKRAADATRKKAKDEADREQYLDQLAKREGAVWSQVAAYIQKRQPKDYDRAVLLLIDLHDLAVRQGDESGFQLELETLRKTHAAKDTFLRRLTKAKLWPELATNSVAVP
jgi:hypothetical protein